MRESGTRFATVRLSLADIVGADYAGAVCGARAAISGEDRRDLARLARRKVDFYPRALQARMAALLPRTGAALARPLRGAAVGATTTAFALNTRADRAAVSALGCFRVAENGHLFLATKSAHYHAPLGHQFPGYALLEIARRLGIPNAAHNNNRGHITRLLEEELVRTANGLARGDRVGLGRCLRSDGGRAINRVLNLETGSLACEAAIKLALARFYKAQSDSPAPEHAGVTPVFLVVGDNDGNLQANYHGTTVLAQIMRGMWPELAARMEAAGAFAVRAVRPNRVQDLEAAFERWNRGRFRIAAFFHEIVMMNYAGILLERAFLRRAYSLCRERNVPTVVDEIQSCMWSPRTFMFIEYGLKPDMIVLGKGMPGGEYPASRILFNAALDRLPQFGALVTNGQEDIASLAYLVTMRWLEANAEQVETIGDYYQARLRDLAARSGGLISAVEGARHMGSLVFSDLERAKSFADRLSEDGFDISVQTYKTSCPPAALTKLPITAGREMVDFVVERMRRALAP